MLTINLQPRIPPTIIHCCQQRNNQTPETVKRSFGAISDWRRNASQDDGWRGEKKVLALPTQVLPLLNRHPEEH